MLKKLFICLLIWSSYISYAYDSYFYPSDVDVNLLEGVFENNSGLVFSGAIHLGDWFLQSKIQKYYQSKSKEICNLTKTNYSNYSIHGQKRLKRLLEKKLGINCRKIEANVEEKSDNTIGALAVDYGLMKFHFMDDEYLFKTIFKNVLNDKEELTNQSRSIYDRDKVSSFFSVEDLKEWFEQPMIKEYFQSRARGICDVLDFREKTYNYYTPETIRVRDSFLSELGITCKKSELSN